MHQSVLQVLYPAQQSLVSWDEHGRERRIFGPSCTGCQSGITEVFRSHELSPKNAVPEKHTSKSGSQDAVQSVGRTPTGCIHSI